MTIQPIVEGHGEVAAVPVLLRRLQAECQVHNIRIGKPIRQHRSQLCQEVTLRRAVRLALLQPDCSAVLVLFDSDDGCPKELGPLVQGWARDEAWDRPCAVVIAYREYEAWFLAAIESLRGKRGLLPDAAPHADPEGPRDAKGELEARLPPGRSYSETADQAALSALFDLAAAYARCRSFRRMAAAFGFLAARLGIALPEWPPLSWQLPPQRPLETGTR